MAIDSVDSSDEIYSYDIEIENLKAFDIPEVDWNGRTVLKTQDNRSIHPILAASLAYEQSAKKQFSVGSEHPSPPPVSTPTFAQINPIPPSIPDAQKQNIDNFSKTADFAEFVKGVSTGFPRGCADSVVEIPSAIATLAKAAGAYVLDPVINPLNHILPGQEIVSQAFAVYETVEYLRTCDGGELIMAVAPEAHKLFTDWDHLSIKERGDLSSYCVGKYGTDFLFPIAAAKGFKVARGILKKATTLGKIETAIGAAAKEVEAVEALMGSRKLVQEGIPLAGQQTEVQKYLSSEELKKNLAEVMANTEKAIHSEAFAEGKAFAIKETAAIEARLTDSLKPIIKNEAISTVNSVSAIANVIAKNELTINSYLGEGTQLITNKAGDLIFLSKDGLRRVRFDFIRPDPHLNPHMHIEYYINGEWKGSGQIYPIDVPHN